MSTAIFTFGRFNPPTIGHMALVDKVKSVAKQNNGKAFIFTGQSTDPKKNPLKYRTKTAYMKKAFKDVVVVASPSIKSVFDALGYLNKKKYTEIRLVVGSDRVSEFKKLINKYLSDYDFESFDVVSAGERDPDATGVRGMSASKMRAAAESGEYSAFRLGCPKTLSKDECLKLFHDVQRGMGVKKHIAESWFNYEEFETFMLNERKISMDTRRKMARNAKRTAKKRARTRKRKEKFRKSGVTLKMVARKQAKNLLRSKIIGDKDWSSLSLSQRAAVDQKLEKKTAAIDKISKKLLPKVKIAERERLQKLKGNTPGQPTTEEVQVLREPEILDRLVQQLKDKGMDNDKAHAVARSQLQKHGVLKKDSQELTDKGKTRNSMTPAERAKDRAAKKDGKNVKDYTYNNKTNIATQKEDTMFTESDKKPLLKWMDMFEKELKKAGSSYKKVDPVDALKLYYRGVTPKEAAPMLKSSKLKESLEEAGTNRSNKSGHFTASHLKQLRVAYGKIGKIDPSSSAYKKLIGYLDSLNKEQLKQIVAAKIPFMSSLALNRVTKLGESSQRDYKKEYENYHSKPEQRANRSKRVLARRDLEKQGRVKKGDGNDVDHRDGNPQNNSSGNLRVLTTSKNRGRDNNKWRNEENGAGEEGTPKLLKKYKDFTPGEAGTSPNEPTPKVPTKNTDPKRTGSAGH